MADSLFDNLDQDKDYLAELTGPGGKFDKTKYTSEADMYKAMAKSTVHADRTLTQRNSEMDELREEFLKVRAENVAKAKWEEILAKREDPDNNVTNTPVHNVEQPIDEKKYEEIAERKYLEIQAKARDKANMDIVEARLRERFGENARSILKDKMSALNLSDEDLKFLARKSPEAVFNTLGLNVQQTTQSLPRSSVRSDIFSVNEEIRDAVYYDELRKKDIKAYFDPKTSVQRLKDMDADPVKYWERANQRRTQFN